MKKYPRLFGLILTLCLALPDPARTAVEPSFSPPGGIYYENLYIALPVSSPGVEIRYTLDGAMPVHSSTLYSQPIVWGSNEDYQLYRKIPAGCNRKNTEALRYVERDRAASTTQQRTHCDQGTLSGL